MVAPDLLDRRDRLVAEEAVGIVERGDERVHRPLRAELRQRRGNVTANPDVLALIAQRVRQCADDRLAVADERVARVALSARDGRAATAARDEQSVRRSHRPGAANGLLDDDEIAVVEQRHEQRAKSQVGDVRQGGGGFGAARGRDLARIRDQLSQRRLGRA